MDQLVRLLSGRVQLGGLIADPTSARLFLFLIDRFARFAQLLFEGLGLFVRPGTRCRSFRSPGQRCLTRSSRHR